MYQSDFAVFVTLGLPSMPQHTYHRSQHRFFDSLVTFIAGASSLGIALDAQKNGIAQGYTPTQYLAYSPSDNGKPVLYHDVTAVELILLMEDMDALV